MAEFLLALVVFILAMTGLSVSVLYGRKPLQGSCGGLNNFSEGAGNCELCGSDRSKCQNRNKV